MSRNRRSFPVLEVEKTTKQAAQPDAETIPDQGTQTAPEGNDDADRASAAPVVGIGASAGGLEAFKPACALAGGHRSVLRLDPTPGRPSRKPASGASRAENPDASDESASSILAECAN